MRNRRLLGNGLLLLTALIWGTAFVFQRIGMESIEPITFNAARMALAAIAVGLVAFLLWKREKGTGLAVPEAQKKKYNKNTILGGIFCGVFLAVASILQQMGLVYTTAGKAGFITAMYMLLVPILGFVLFKKKYNWLVWIAVILGVTGMYYLCITEEFSLSNGDILIGISALFFSGHILCCDFFVQRGNPIRISAIQFATVTVISAVAAVILEEPGIEKITSAFIPIIYCGIVSGGIGYTLQIIAQKYTEPAIASLLMSMESVFALLAGVLLLNEHLTVRELIGCIIMFTAIILVQLPSLKEK